MTNHKLNKYDYNEGGKFTGLMTALMAIDGMPTIGKGAKDGIETIDFQEIVSNYNDSPSIEPRPKSNEI